MHQHYLYIYCFFKKKNLFIYLFYLKMNKSAGKEHEYYSAPWWRS